jgi:hypothetical protein
MGTKINDEQFRQKLAVYKQLLLEEINTLQDYDRYATGMSLYHKCSFLPRNCQLYVSISPNINKFTVGIKLFRKHDFFKFKEVFNNIPFDLKDRIHETTRYVDASTIIKFENVPDKETIELVKKAINFYKEYFKEFLRKE